MEVHADHSGESDAILSAYTSTVDTGRWKTAVSVITLACVVWGHSQLIIDARPRRLRSADTRTLLVSRTHTNFGNTAFSAAGSRVWNYLPNDLTDNPTCHTAVSDSR